MAFHTYTCEKYITYIKESFLINNEIYNLIISSPFTKTELGKHLSLSHPAMARKIKLRNLTHQEKINLLEFIK